MKWNVVIRDLNGDIIDSYYDGDVEKIEKEMVYNTAYDSIYEFYRRDPESVKITVEAI